MKKTIIIILAAFIVLVAGEAKGQSKLQLKDHYYFVSWSYNNGKTSGNSNAKVQLSFVPNSMDIKILVHTLKADTSNFVLMSFNRLTKDEYDALFLDKTHIVRIEKDGTIISGKLH